MITIKFEIGREKFRMKYVSIVNIIEQTAGEEDNIGTIVSSQLSGLEYKNTRYNR
jgi:hypothetical protein